MSNSFLYYSITKQYLFSYSLDYIDEVADESNEGIIYDSLAFLTKKLVIEGVFLQTYEFKCSKLINEGSVSYLCSYYIFFLYIYLDLDCSLTKSLNVYYT